MHRARMGSMEHAAISSPGKQFDARRSRWGPSPTFRQAAVRRPGHPSLHHHSCPQWAASYHHSPRKQSIRHWIVCSANAQPDAGSSVALTEVMATLTGYCVLIGSVFRSVPQIIRIVSNSSVEGLSLTSFVSELIAYSVMWAYNYNLGYPFSTFGEIVLCWFQDIILVGLVLHYRKQIDLKVAFWALVFVAFMGMLMTNACGSTVLYTLQASTIAMIALGARMPQIVLNYRRGNSGELSLLTCLLNVMGCFARMFTTIVLTKDTLNFAGAGIQAVLNGMLLYQTVQTARGAPQGPPAKPKAA